MATPVTLVDVDKLRELIAALPLRDKALNGYIDARWLNYVEWWDARARDARRKYYALRASVVVAAALVPAFVAARELDVWQAPGRDYGWIFAIASIGASLVVAVCGGLESLYGFGEIWREKRAAAEIIKSEGFSFFQLTGPYAQFATHDEGYETFGRNVEELIRSEIKDYIVAVNPKSRENGSGKQTT
jgi:hypothetical protein